MKHCLLTENMEERSPLKNNPRETWQHPGMDVRYTDGLRRMRCRGHTRGLHTGRVVVRRGTERRHSLLRWSACRRCDGSCGTADTLACLLACSAARRLMVAYQFSGTAASLPCLLFVAVRERLRFRRDGLDDSSTTTSVSNDPRPGTRN